MRAIKQVVFHAALVFSLVLMLLSMSSRADTITIRADSWYPYNDNPDNSRPGYMMEIAKKAWSEAGHKIDYQLLDWDKSIEAVRAGRFDCVVGAIHSDAPDFIFPQIAMGITNSVFFKMVEGDGWKYTGIDSLKGRRIGAIEGYSYDEGEIDTYLKNKENNVHFASGDNALEGLINMMADGKLDTVIEDSTVFKATSRRMGVNFLFQEAGDTGALSPVYIACSPKKGTSQNYVDLIDKTISAMRSSGELEKLLDDYGLQDWE